MPHILKYYLSEYIHHNYFENKNQVNICLYHIPYFHYNITGFYCKKNCSIAFDRLTYYFQILWFFLPAGNAFHSCTVQILLPAAADGVIC